MNRTQSPAEVWLCIAFSVACALLARCDSGDGLAGGASETGNTDVGVLRVETYSEAPSAGVEYVYVEVETLEAYHESLGWLTVSSTPHRVDYLALRNGRTAVLGDTIMPVGSYEQLRLRLSDEHQLVVAQKTYSLSMPNGQTNSITIDVDFTIEAGDSTRVYLDFNVEESVREHDGGYVLVPTFSASPAGQTGGICGFVRDGAERGIAGVRVEARGANNTYTTLTDDDGAYHLWVPAGTYTVLCHISCCRYDSCGVHAFAHSGIVVVACQTTQLDFNSFWRCVQYQQGQDSPATSDQSQADTTQDSDSPHMGFGFATIVQTQP